LTKECGTCKEEKDISCFYKSKNKRDGLNYRCKSCITKRRAEYRKVNLESILLKSKAYRDKNKEKIKGYHVKYRSLRKESIKESGKKYYKSKSKKINDYNKKYIKKRRGVDVLYRLIGNYRARTRAAFKAKGVRKLSVARDLIGGDYEIAKLHIQRQFKKGMTWGNHGHGKGFRDIGHIIPLSSAITD